MAAVPQNWTMTRETPDPTPRPPRLPGWEGRSTIAHVNKDSVERFHSLPPEAHARLQAATERLVAENSITKRILQKHGNTAVDVSSMSAVERYELARYQVDHPPENATPRTVARQKPTTSMRDDYVHHLVSYIPRWKASTSHLYKVEDFRKTVTRVADTAIEDFLPDGGPKSLPLRCVGSYLSGFALADSNLDLLMNTNDIPADIRARLPTYLAKSLLEAGFCAALTTDPRSKSSTILKIYEKSSPEFLESLKRQASDTHDDVYFSESLGTQCHIRFSTEDTMYHASDLMRRYHLCDNRVVQMVFFIKKWVKMRRISSPEDGMLPTYGYMLMLLHYLIHVAYPAVVPNLQHGKPNDGSYWSNKEEMSSKSRYAHFGKNRQSTETLLRGFFAYYSSQPILIQRGTFKIQPFIFKRQVVSLGDKPCVHKAKKGWLDAYNLTHGRKQWRYLAIEDPFDHDHNVAEDVNPTAANIIRDEFTRAYKIVTRTQFIPGTGWQWRTDEGKIGDELLDIRNPTQAELDGFEPPKRENRPRPRRPSQPRPNGGLNRLPHNKRYPQDHHYKGKQDTSEIRDQEIDLLKSCHWMEEVQLPHNNQW